MKKLSPSPAHAAAVRALSSEPSCVEVVVVNRRSVELPAGSRVRQVILDTAAAAFPAEVTELARATVALGERVCGASCVGVAAEFARGSAAKGEVVLENGAMRELARHRASP